jgi:hypothetical protein
MNQPEPGIWPELASVWKSGASPITANEIEKLHQRQRRRARVASAAGLVCTMLGVSAALWLALGSRFRWVGIVTAIFLVTSVYFVLRSRRSPDPPGSTDLLQSLQDALDYHDWLAEQLRYGRVLGFMALFAVVMAASTQLLHEPEATRSGLLGTAAAAIGIMAALAWNMSLAWQVWRRRVRLHAFRRKLAQPDVPPEWLSLLK